MKLTAENIEAGKSLNGGWSRKQTDLLGVEWPLKAGWKKDLVGKEIPDEDHRVFLALKDLHLQSGQLEIIASDMLRKSKKKPKVHPTIKARAQMLVGKFSDKTGRGSHLTTCTATTCTYPECMCL